MEYKLKVWHKVLLLLIFPPVGAYFICSGSDVRPVHKFIAIAYCAVLFLLILAIRSPEGNISVIAQPLN